RVRHRRKFNRPTGLDEWERVWLEVDRTMCAGEVLVGETPVGRLAPGEYFAADITPHLQRANEISVDVEPGSVLQSPPPSSTIYVTPDPDAPPSSPVGEVRLVIRAVSRD